MEIKQIYADMMEWRGDFLPTGSTQNQPGLHRICEGMRLHAPQGVVARRSLARVYGESL